MRLFVCKIWSLHHRYSNYFSTLCAYQQTERMICHWLLEFTVGATIRKKMNYAAVIYWVAFSVHGRSGVACKVFSIPSFCTCRDHVVLVPCLANLRLAGRPHHPTRVLVQTIEEFVSGMPSQHHVVKPLTADSIL